MLEKIDFNCFFMCTKQKIEPYLYKLLNPYDMQFFKAGDIFFALTSSSKDTIYVNMTVGSGIEGFRELVKSCNEGGIRYITFGCSEHNMITQKIYKYAKAELLGRKEDYYGENHAMLEYRLDLLNNPRLSR